MTEQAMAELEEIRTTAQYHEHQLLDVAADVPGLTEMLGSGFFKPLHQAQSEDPVQQYLLVGEYLEQLWKKIERLRVALMNLQFWEEYDWGEAMLKLMR
jgi:hypothetical protein